MTTIPLSELAGAHLGKTVTIATDDGDVTGLLLGANHQANVNETYGYGAKKPVARLIVEQRVFVTLKGWGERGFWPTTKATIHEPGAAA